MGRSGVRFNNTTPLSGGDISAYVSYMAGGGSLFVMGENTGFVTRNNSIVSLVQTAGGGTLTVTNPNNVQTVQPPFTGPNPVSTITFLAAAGAPSPPGTGASITKDGSNISAAIIFSPNSMSNALNGTLAIVFDVNFMDLSADANSQALLKNMVAYLAAPVPVALPPATPAPPTVILMLLGMSGWAIYQWRRSRRQTAAPSNRW